MSRARRAGVAGAAKHFALAALASAICFASACSSDSTSEGGSPEAGAGGDGGGSGSGGKSGASGSAGAAGKAGSGGASGSGNEPDSGGACTGAPSKGTNDATHCKEADGGAIAQKTGTCVPDSGDAGAEPPASDAGAPSDYGDTLYGNEGDDDDCKYHVKYAVAPICEKEGVTFTVTVTNTADGKPTTGAHPYLELTLNDLPPSTADKQKATEKAGGVYDIGPVVFDKPGKWTARFHFFEECSDEPEDSPHGHVAFFIDVP